MAIVKRPKVIDPKILVSDKVVLSPNGKLYDSEAAMKNAYSAANVTFSWEPQLKITDNIPEEEIPQTAVPDKEPEYVVIEEKPKTKTSDYIRNGIFGAIVCIMLLVGGKGAFDYVQEAESFKLINTQLESEIDSDLPSDVKKELSLFGKKEKPKKEEEPAPSSVNNSLPDFAFTQIIKTKPYYLAAKRNDGQIELRTGGTVGWRTNNPAEFAYEEFAKKTGAIGEYSKYAIYPTKELGMKAVEVYLFNTNVYSELSIDKAIKKFYNESASKGERVAKAISIALNKSRYNTLMKDLSDTQKQITLNEIWKEEENLKGIVRLFASEKEFEEKGF